MTDTSRQLGNFEFKVWPPQAGEIGFTSETTDALDKIEVTTLPDLMLFVTEYKKGQFLQGLGAELGKIVLKNDHVFDAVQNQSELVGDLTQEWNGAAVSSFHQGFSEVLLEKLHELKIREARI